MDGGHPDERESLVSEQDLSLGNSCKASDVHIKT